MKYLFVLNHPAHYHLFKNVITELNIKGHNCIVYIRPKDVLEKLLKFDLIPYKLLIEPSKKDNNIIIRSTAEFINKVINLGKEVNQGKPDLLIGTDWVITIVGKYLNIPSLIFNEDDTKATPENKIFYPLARTLILPNCCDENLWRHKKVNYHGYHELAYLHPNWFKPNFEVIREIRKSEKPYILIRLVKLTASHDIGKKGLGIDILHEIINIVKDEYQIYISFEGNPIDNLKEYNYTQEPTLMHSFMAGANLIIGDSQTMIAEAAVLGTPAIRFNDFVGKLSYLDEIENKYTLAYGFKTNEKEKLLHKVKEILGNKEIKTEWRNKLKKLLSDKIDVTAFFVWFIENYPDSIRINNQDPFFQNKFK